MAKINLKKIIGNNSHWTLNKSIVRQIGLTETLVLQHIIDLESVFKRDEIFQPINEMADELGISEWAVKQAIGKLRSSDLISVERKSVGYKNFYSVNQEKVLEYVSGSVNQPVSSNSTHQSVGHAGEVESNSLSDEKQLTVSCNTTMSEVKSNSQWDENLSAITNNTTNNTLPRIDTKNTTAASAGDLQNIIQKVLDILIDANSTDEDYNNAIEDFKDLGGINGIAADMGWDDSVKENWYRRIKNVNAIITQ